MSNTGHDEFDRLASELSATIKEIEVALRERASGDSKNDKESRSGTNKLIVKASSILSKLSSVTKSVSEREEPGLKQELVDIYKAYKMQMKTFKSLHQQPELFKNKIGTRASCTEKLESEKLTLFSSSGGKTVGSDELSSRWHDTSGTRKNNFSRNGHSRDGIVSNTQGRVGKQNSRLQDALKSLAESEQVAQEISGELQGQRETLQKAHGRMDQFSAMTEYSKTLLNSMNKPWWRKW